MAEGPIESKAAAASSGGFADTEILEWAARASAFPATGLTGIEQISCRRLDFRALWRQTAVSLPGCCCFPDPKFASAGSAGCDFPGNDELGDLSENDDQSTGFDPLDGCCAEARRVRLWKD